MSTMVKATPFEQDIREGNQCLLHAMGQHFLVEILEVGDRTLNLTFPGKDYPVAGMLVDLEVHDEEGFNYYPSQVVEGPGPKNKGLVLKRPTEVKRNCHRKTCRVPTDLTVQVRDQVHLRRYDAALLNLSANGAFIESEASFDFETTVELTLSLPGEPTHTILAKIVHLSEKPRRGRGRSCYYGLDFISPERKISRSITDYIWNRLKELYPSN